MYFNLEEDIKILNLSKEAEKRLKDNNVDNIKKLWILKREDLKNMGFKDSQINHIIIHMQLKGIDLNKKTY